MFIQEHKLRGQGALNLGRSLWRRATTFCTEAEIGYTPDGSNAGKGGIASLIAPKWAKFISQSGSICGGRVHWFILKRLSGGDIGFANIYALHEPHPRRVLWESMARELPNTCRWILLGDFNMVERRVDKSSTCGKSMPNIERLLFNSLKDSLHVVEPPLTMPSLLFSWDNARQNSSRIMARLDRIYIFTDPVKVVEYRIRGDSSRSDHSPVSMVLEFANPSTRPSQWIMSSTYLEDAHPMIREIWAKAPPSASFFHKLKKITRFYRGFCIRRSKINREAEDALRLNLDLKTRQL